MLLSVYLRAQATSVRNRFQVRSRRRSTSRAGAGPCVQPGPLFRRFGQRLPLFRDNEHQGARGLAAASVPGSVNSVLGCYMREFAFSQRDWLLAVWRDDKRAFQNINVLIAVMGMPCAFSSRHYISDIDNRLLANNVREVGPMQFCPLDWLVLGRCKPCRRTRKDKNECRKRADNCANAAHC